MILSNVNIGTGPSAGDGDPLRTAFTIINNNFQTITNNVNSLTNSVNTVAGRTGNVILTVNDIVGLTTNYAVNGNVTAANLGMRGYVDSKITANIALLVNAAPSTLDTIRELADAIGDDPNFAVNIALSVSTANTQMRGYVDGQITAANTASATANVGMTGYVNQANTIIKSYVDGQITAANAGVTAANLGMKGYVDQANTIQSAQVGAANLAIIAANLGMKGYVDSVAGGSYSNVNTQAYLITNSYATQAFVNDANTALKVYTDGQVTAANAGVTAANLGMKGYVDSVASQSIYGNGNVLSYLTQFDGNIIPSANVTYSLGSITNQWKDLFVSNNTIFIGGVPLSIDAAGNLLVNGNAVSGGGGTATGIESASTISITNADYSNSVDINILSGDDITIQGKNKTTSDSEGGDITINAGNGGDADAGDAAGGGGDITIRAGQGGLPSAAYNGGFGGTLDLYGGTGGDSDPGNNRTARDGGRARLQAGSAGSNNGNIALGAVGGPVEITAGQTTLADNNGGIVTITSGQAGANALAGYVEINIPSSDLGQGGSWYFTGTGRTLEAPQDGEIWQPNAGNLSVASAGNVFIRSYDGVQHEWQFGHTGDLTLPGSIVNGNSELNFVASSSGDGGGYTTMQLVPDNTVTGPDQYIIIDPTIGAPAGHIHIRAGGTQDDSSANLYLGGENSYFKIPHGSNPSVTVAANSYEWIFGSDGRLQLPDIGEASSEIYTAVGGISIKSPAYTELRYSSTDPANVSPTSNVDGFIWITNDGAHIQNYHGGEFNHEWTFGTGGNLTIPGGIIFPDTTVQTTAYTGDSYSNVQVAAYLPTYTGNIAAGNVRVSSGYRFETGNVTITNESGHVNLTPDTTLSGTAGVKIGGSGFLLGPNSARNLTLNYGGISGALGIQANVTIGSGGSGNLFVVGNVIARDITGGNILATGTSGVIGFNGGGFVQQATSNATQVTSHFTSGNIQLMSIDLGANAVHTVTFACNKLTTNDLLLVKHISGGLTSVYVDAYVASDGLAVIWLRDITGNGTGAFTPMLKYAIVRAPSS